MKNRKWFVLIGAVAMLAAGSASAFELALGLGKAPSRNDHMTSGSKDGFFIWWAKKNGHTDYWTLVKEKKYSKMKGFVEQIEAMMEDATAIHFLCDDFSFPGHGAAVPKADKRGELQQGEYTVFEALLVRDKFKAKTKWYLNDQATGEECAAPAKKTKK
jgi:hypothetical protein